MKEAKSRFCSTRIGSVNMKNLDRLSYYALKQQNQILNLLDFLFIDLYNLVGHIVFFVTPHCSVPSLWYIYIYSMMFHDVPWCSMDCKPNSYHTSSETKQKGRHWLSKDGRGGPGTGSLEHSLSGRRNSRPGTCGLTSKITLTRKLPKELWTLDCSTVWT